MKFGHAVKTGLLTSYASIPGVKLGYILIDIFSPRRSAMFSTAIADASSNITLLAESILILHIGIVGWAFYASAQAKIWFSDVLFHLTFAAVATAFMFWKWGPTGTSATVADLMLVHFTACALASVVCLPTYWLVSGNNSFPHPRNRQAG